MAFAAINSPADSYGGDRTSFIGRNRSLADPAAMERTGLSSRTGAGLDPCAALQVVLEMAPGERLRSPACWARPSRWRRPGSWCSPTGRIRRVEAALEQTRAWWDALLGTVEVHTPELAADFLVNRWLLYQT